MFMKANHLLPIAAFCLMTASCNTGKQQAELTAGIQLANLDTTALPGTDFYQYACGGWMKNNPIPAEYSQYGSFTILAENNRKQIQGLIEELAATQHEAGSVAQKIGDLYKIVMDSVKLNKDGVAPIKAELDQLAALKDKKELYALLGDMQKKGIIAYNVLYVGADEMNSSMNAVQTYQTGLSMGEREYYLENDEATAKIRDAFRTHVQKMYQLAGFDEATAKKGMELDIDLSDCEYSSFIDFQHAVLNFCLDQWYVEDLGSQNGVKVGKVEDGECYRVIHRPCKVVAGDVLYIANTKLLLT